MHKEIRANIQQKVESQRLWLAKRQNNSFKISLPKQNPTVRESEG